MSISSEQGDPIALARDALMAGDKTPTINLAECIADIVNDELWRQGGIHSCFGKFAVARVEDGGLEVRTLRRARLLRFALLEVELFREWTEVMEEIARRVGHPKTLANGEDFERFYQIPTSSNATDRTLWTLSKRHPEIYDELGNGEISLPSAAIKAGLRQPNTGLNDRIKAGKIVEGHNLLDMTAELFDAMSPDYQASFIRHKIEPVLSMDLGTKWQELKKQRKHAE